MLIETDQMPSLVWKTENLSLLFMWQLYFFIIFQHSFDFTPFLLDTIDIISLEYALLVWL